MLASTAGERAATFTLDKAGVEAVKWLAFALMVADHLARYAFPSLGPIPWLLGRLVFPLFALAFGMVAYTAAASKDWRPVYRLVVWGLVAQVPMAFAVPKLQALNVLFTFACGLILGRAFFAGAPIWRRCLGGVLALIASCACEYGPIGAALVASALWWGSSHSRWSLAAVAASIGLLTAINGTAFGVLALPLGLAMLRWPIEVPRIPRLFYYGYVAQWALVWAVA